MSGTLYVVATPIGNLEDITLRALRVLREADVIAAEDTRRTAKLLAHHGISTPTLSFHEHNARSRIPQLLARLKGNARIALVTDAGTPGISDPGVELVRACVEEGVEIDPIPGVSAPITAAIASGFPLEPLTILGFPPSRSKDRAAWLTGAARIGHTFTFFEAPHRVAETLREMGPIFGERPIMVGRELTKLHQEFVRAANPIAIIGQLTSIKGEFTVVVGPLVALRREAVDVTDEEIALEFGRITQMGSGGRRAALSAVARKYRKSSKEVYAIIERTKKYGE